MFLKRLSFLTLVLLVVCSAAFALTPEAIEICLKRGESSRIFPDGTTADDLIAETYTIHALGESYRVWVVSTQNQRSDVEFGWMSIHEPSNTVLQSSRTRNSYQDAVRMLEWEQIYGCNYFWTSDLKAKYHQELWGNESRITAPNETEITEAEAIAIARQTLMQDIGLEETLLDSLPVSAEFYQDNNPKDSVQSERFWGITFREHDLSLRFPPLFAVVIDGMSGIPEYSVDYQKDLIFEHIK